MSLSYAKWTAKQDADMIGPDYVKEWLIKRVEELEYMVNELEYAIRVRESQMERDGHRAHDSRIHQVVDTSDWT